jgi:hypothetical protein
MPAGPTPRFPGLDDLRNERAGHREEAGPSGRWRGLAGRGDLENIVAGRVGFPCSVQVYPNAFALSLVTRPLPGGTSATARVRVLAIRAKRSPANGRLGYDQDQTLRCRCLWEFDGDGARFRPWSERRRREEAERAHRHARHRHLARSEYTGWASRLSELRRCQHAGERRRSRFFS